MVKSSFVAPKPLAVSSNVQLGSVNPEFGRMPDGRPICPVCHATFGKIPEAKRHFQSKHSGVTFRCEICGSEMSRKDVFKSHLMKKHGLSSTVINAMADQPTS